MTSSIDLHEKICGETSYLEHHEILLIPDRCLGPNAERLLSESRIRGNPQSKSWPSSGIFTISRFAEKLYWNFLEKNPHWPAEIMSSIEHLLGLQHQNVEKTFPEIYSHYKRSTDFQKITAEIRQCHKLLEEFPEKEAPEHALWEKALASYLRQLTLALEQKKLAHRWQCMEYLCDSNASIKSSEWARVFERNPFKSDEKLKVIIPTYKELYPLERKFLKFLEKHLELCYIENEKTDEEEFSLKLDDNRNIDAIVRSPDGPGALGLSVLLNSGERFNQNIALEGAVSPLAAAFCRYCDYHQKRKADNHPLIQNFSDQKQLAYIKIDWKTGPEIDDFFRVFQVAGDSPLEQLIAKNISTPRSLVEVLISEKTPLMDESRESLPLPYSHSFRGLPVLNLEDLPLCPVRRPLFLGSKKTFEDCLDPLTPLNNARNLFTPSIRNFLESQNMAVPEVQQELKQLKSILARLPLHWNLIDVSRRDFQLQHSLQLESTTTKKTLSPSSVEALLRCPFQFYAERILGLEALEAEDSQRINPLRMGSWIHKVLERFFIVENWDSVKEKLRETLKEELHNYFESSSPSYKKILSSQSEVISERLERHLLEWEKVLWETFPERRCLLEEKIHCKIEGRSFTGKIDRIDILPGKGYMIWDYKTGKTSGAPKTQLKNNKIQFFLYEKMLQEPNSLEKHFVDCPPTLLGGGYVNPLEPQKSSVFFRDESIFHQLQEPIKSYGLPYHRIDKNKKELGLLLEEKLAQVFEQIQLGVYPPKPHKKNLCLQCQQRSFCGRPYLGIEN